MKDGNRRPWQVWEKRVEGSQKAKDRMGRAYVTNVEKKEAFVEGDWAGKGKESVPHLADATQCLRGNQILDEAAAEKSLVHAMNITLDLLTHSPVTLLTKLTQLYVIHKNQSLERLNS
jgi:hypothetical protein